MGSDQEFERSCQRIFFYLKLVVFKCVEIIGEVVEVLEF